MRVKIVIWGNARHYSIYADDVTQEYTYGLKQAKLPPNFIKQVVGIVRDWPDVLEDKSMTDGIHYKIAYEEGSTSRQIIGSNKTPENFSTLMYIINKNSPDNAKFNLQEQRLRNDIAAAYDAIERGRNG